MLTRNTIAGSVAGILLASAAAYAVADGGAILAEAGIHGGLVVHLGCGDGRTTAQLYGGEGFLVHGLDTDAGNVARARQYVQSQNLYGKVAIDQLDGNKLPFVDNLATLVVADETTVPMSEILRVLHPLGVALVDGKKTIKPWPQGMDEWTHFLHGADNNAVANDSAIGPPRHMQFLAAPLWSRHHDRLASISTAVTAKGRLFYIGDNGPLFDPNESAHWTLTARNAFSGLLLWTKPISTWTNFLRKFRSGPVQLQRLLVTDGDRVLTTLGLGEPVSVLDAATGDEVAVLAETENAEELLLQDGVLYVLIGAQGAEQALLEQNPIRADYRSKRITAIDVSSRKTLWHYPKTGSAEIMPQTLAVSGGRVFFQEGGATACLDAAGGAPRWKTPLPAVQQTATETPPKKKQGKAKANSKFLPSGRAPGWTFATLVAQDGVVLSCDGQTLTALDAASGKQLWQCAAATPFNMTPSVDILVVDGVVWTSPDLNEGRDLRTGQIVASNRLSDELVTPGHHHRCYRNKATSRYLIQGYRGLEFRDTEGDEHFRHNWIRGICQYGIMPANGMVYIPPHSCSCYPEAKLFGLWALKSSESAVELDSLVHNTKLEKGPAYGAVKGTPAQHGSDQWPMHRLDPRRSAVSTSAVSTGRVAWAAALGGRLSQAVIADDTLLVSAVDNHQVLALDPGTGKSRWNFTAGGRIDSPPTIHGDLALFGSADGYAYCLRLSDGELVWRLRAAPANVKTVALGQVESLWPVHGSILVADGMAYFTAGRSSHIDGGLFLYGVDPVSGAVKCAERLHSPPAPATKNAEGIAKEEFIQNAVDFKTAQSPDHSDAFSMSGNLSDILLADGDRLYLRHMQLDKQLRPTGEWKHHLFSTSRLLDDTESFRAHWFYGNGDFSRLPVAYEWLTRGSYGGFSSPLGRFLVFDGETLWGTGWKDLALYSTDIRGIDSRLEKDFPKDDAKIEHQKLVEKLPIHPRAMIKAGPILYIAGYPADSTIAHVSGEPIRDGGILLEVQASTGRVQASKELPACPVFDGISAADGRLYLSLENGSVVCLD
ncbi:MAG: PQQ-binding-like beta-propeller repeat protein [Planctomycetota bacterium]